MKRPKISVVMSVYNGEKYLEESIKSVLNQTFKNFEFIIINDGSTDGTDNILEKFRKQDTRIKMIRQKNVGLTKSLNKGVKLAQGKYIARIDADDIAMPERLEKQLEFMESNLRLGAIGCWYYMIDKDGKIIKKCKPPTELLKIKKSLLNSVALIHPALMIKKEVLEKVNFYDEKFRYAQDRDLLFRIIEHYQQGIVPKFLLKFRYTNESISLQKEIEQKKYCMMAIKRAIKNGIYPKWCYIFILRFIISIHLPTPVRILKNKLFRIIGLRHD